jgi:ATP-dependent DNA helicase RecQ
LNIDINPLTPREDNYTIKPVIELVKKIYSIKKKKIDKMIQYIQDDNSCKQNFILAYFGENKIEICKKCSSKSCFIFSKQKEELKEKVITLLKSNPHSILELSQKLYFDLRDLKFFLNNLLDQKSIKKGIGEKYYWVNE